MLAGSSAVHGAALAGAVLAIVAPPAGAAAVACSNTCAAFGNGICQDGGDSSEGAYCTYGTDCDDCGGRSLERPSPASATVLIVVIVVVLLVLLGVALVLGRDARLRKQAWLALRFSPFCELCIGEATDGPRPLDEEEEGAARGNASDELSTAPDPMASDGDGPATPQTNPKELRVEAERQRLRDRLATAGGDANTIREFVRLELEDRELEFETAGAAEAAVAAAGSPDAALLAAVNRGASAREVRALLQRGANADASFLDRGALAIAVRTSGPGAVVALLEAGATLEQKDAKGWTPLMHAIDAHVHDSGSAAQGAHGPRESVVLLLLDAGAAVDVWGDDLEGPLDIIRSLDKSQGGEAQPSAPGSAATAKSLDLPHLLREKSGAGSASRGCDPFHRDSFCGGDPPSLPPLALRAPSLDATLSEREKRSSFAESREAIRIESPAGLRRESSSGLLPLPSMQASMGGTPLNSPLNTPPMGGPNFGASLGGTASLPGVSVGDTGDGVDPEVSWAIGRANSTPGERSPQD